MCQIFSDSVLCFNGKVKAKIRFQLLFYVSGASNLIRSWRLKVVRLTQSTLTCSRFAALSESPCLLNNVKLLSSYVSRTRVCVTKSLKTLFKLGSLLSCHNTGFHALVLSLNEVSVVCNCSGTRTDSE